MRSAARSALMATMLALAMGRAPAFAEPFVADSKRLGNGKMDIVVREIERRARISVLAIEIQAVGSSVGSSFFILCSVRDLAKLRGPTSHIAKIERSGKPSRMVVGFLAGPDEEPASLGPEFAGLRAPQDVIDLEQFAPICDRMSQAPAKDGGTSR